MNFFLVGAMIAVVCIFCDWMITDAIPRYLRLLHGETKLPIRSAIIFGIAFAYVFKELVLNRQSLGVFQFRPHRVGVTRSSLHHFISYFFQRRKSHDPDHDF